MAGEECAGGAIIGDVIGRWSNDVEVSRWWNSVWSHVVEVI
jgi:hypothetical protein